MGDAVRKDLINRSKDKGYVLDFILGFAIGAILGAVLVMLILNIMDNKPKQVIVDLPEEYMEITPNTPIYGEYRKDTLHIHFNHGYDNAININPEYMIELINQDSVKISNGKVIETLPFEDIGMYIEFDNL